MEIYPAIDLKDGVCVRLKGGDMDQATVFNADPAAQAKAFESEGFLHLHVVDLDGAFAGAPVNAAAVEAILAACSLPVQLGGGIRNRARIEDWLARGVARVILGTAALRDPDLVREAARAHPGRVLVGVDARDGRVAVEGWAQTSDLTVKDMALRFEDAGVAGLIYTDISRDGLLTGVNVDATAALSEAVSIPVIASGGVADIGDIAALRARRTVAGCIIGKALYEGRIAAAEALAAASA